jgi:imidazolonepropionase-like amidohydrolase
MANPKYFLIRVMSLSKETRSAQYLGRTRFQNPEATVIDCNSRVLMPGLIDAHVHSSTLNITPVVQTPVSYLAHFAADFMRASLDRGFTMLRDVSGGDVGLAHAIRDGLLKGVPRIFCGERLISQTGGHGDFRPGGHNFGIHRGRARIGDAFAVVADGPARWVAKRGRICVEE